MKTATGSEPTTVHRNLGSDPTNTDLVNAARAGSADAWNQLVDRFGRLVWHVVRSFRLSNAAAEDAVQVVWMSAIEKLDQLRDPERIGAWLATTARNAAIAEWHKKQRQVSVGSDFTGFDRPYDEPDRVVEDEEISALLRAYENLSDEDRQLLRLTVAEPHLAYEDIAELINRPIGSIGPSRARALDRLRRQYEAQMAERVLAGVG